MQEEDLRLKSKLQKLEEILEKQRWSQKEAAIKFEKAVARLEQEIEDLKFDSDYNKEQIKHYKLVLENLEEGIYTMDAAGDVKPLNKIASSLIDEEGITPVLLTASTPTGIDRTETSEDLMIWQNHSIRARSIRARSMRDEEGKIIGSLAVIRPIKDEPNATGNDTNS